MEEHCSTKGKNTLPESRQSSGKVFMEEKGGGQDSIADSACRKAYNKKNSSSVWELKLCNGIWELVPVTVLHKAYDLYPFSK